MSALTLENVTYQYKNAQRAAVAFDGDSLAGLDLDRYRRESISMIFQAFHLFPLMTVMENVCFPMELCGVNPKDAKPRAEP